MNEKVIINNAEKIKIFKSDENKVIAVFIKCNLFEKVFYIGKDIEYISGAWWEDSIQKQRIEIKYFNDNHLYYFDSKQEVEWAKLETFKTQINKLIELSS